MDERGDIQRAWLTEIMRQHRVNASEVARRAGIDRSTITRFLKAQTKKLNDDKVSAIAAGFGEAEPAYIPLSGFAEGGLASIDGADPSASFVPPRLAHEADFLVTNDEMAHADIRRGDILRINLNAKPKEGSLVIAQLYHGDDATTVCRFFDMPWLYSGSTDPALRRPIMFNDRNVRIAGVVVRQFRERIWDSVH